MNTINLPLSRERVEAGASDYFSFKSENNGMIDMIRASSDMMSESWTKYAAVVPIQEGIDLDDLVADVEYALTNMLVGIKLNKIINEGYIPLHILMSEVVTVVTDDGVITIDDREITAPIVDNLRTLYIETNVYVSNYGRSVDDFRNFLKK